MTRPAGPIPLLTGRAREAFADGVRRHFGLDFPGVRGRALDEGVGRVLQALGEGEAGLLGRLERADPSSSRQHTGLGLGLAIVKHLVELHGGDLRAKSEGVGRGATFVVSLPCEPGQAEPTAQPAVGDEQALPSLAGRRVVVVDDDDDDDDDDAREVLSIILAGRGADVRGAASAREGYALFEALRPDVLVSDIGMPVENGLSFIGRVREHPLGKALPAIALSAYTDPQTARAAAAAGFDTHLGKPVDADALVRAVATLRRT